MILCDARRFGRISRFHPACVLLCCCAMLFAVGCKGGKAPEASRPAPAAATEAPTSPKQELAEEPRALTPMDNLSCGARIDMMGMTFGGKPSGTLVGFECLDKAGKTRRLKLKSKEFKDGKIETVDFGTILMTNETGTSATYEMTESQIKNLSAFLGF